MSDIDAEISERYAKHRAAVRASRAKLQGLPPDAPSYEAAFEDLVDSVNGLLAYEARIPALRTEPQRALSQRIISWTAWIQAAAAVLLGLAAIPGWVTWGWIFLLIVHLITALITGIQEVSPGQHHTERLMAIAVNVLGVFAAVLALGVISAWFTVLYLIGVLGANAVMLDSGQAAEKEMAA